MAGYDAAERKTASQANVIVNHWRAFLKWIPKSERLRGIDCVYRVSGMGRRVGGASDSSRLNCKTSR